MHTNVLLYFLFVALTLESLQRLFAVPLLSLKLLFKDLDGLVEGFNGCAFHLQLLRQRETFQSSSILSSG